VGRLTHPSVRVIPIIREASTPRQPGQSAPVGPLCVVAGGPGVCAHIFSAWCGFGRSPVNGGSCLDGSNAPGGRPCASYAAAQAGQPRFGTGRLAVDAVVTCSINVFRRSRRVKSPAFCRGAWTSLVLFPYEICAVPRRPGSRSAASAEQPLTAVGSCGRLPMALLGCCGRSTDGHCHAANGDRRYVTRDATRASDAPRLLRNLR